MLENAPLGKTTTYIETYAPDQLFPIPRSMARDKIGIDSEILPFNGVDIWNGFELSWLNPKGKPEVALIELRFSCLSAKIVESKSLKLYLNSFNQSTFESMAIVEQIIAKDLSDATEAAVEVKLTPLRSAQPHLIGKFPGLCLDDLDIETDCYTVNTNFLKISLSGTDVEETLYSDLLKSNCLATGQPDWGSLLIRYRGPKIEHEGLLKYIVSFRQHSGFAEHCVEQIFNDLTECCQPVQLTVYARYTKRGGLDINPFRSNFETALENVRLVRQ